MRNLLNLVLISVMLTAVAFAKNPSDSWQVVQDIPTGWRMAVVTEFTFPCIFVQATDDELICRVPQRRWDERDLSETHVRRDRIREIRVDRRNGANALMGGSIGGGTGAIFGALASSGARGTSAYGLGLVGVLMGAHMGNDVHLLKGKAIYRANPGAAPLSRSLRQDREVNPAQKEDTPSPSQVFQMSDAIAQSVP